MPGSACLRLDLNSPVFQRQLLGLPKDVQSAALATLRKLLEMSWLQLYRDPGLRWEAIVSRRGPNGERLYSLRLGRTLRVVAVREGEWLRLLTLHSDHDSAYR